MNFEEDKQEEKNNTQEGREELVEEESVNDGDKRNYETGEINKEKNEMVEDDVVEIFDEEMKFNNEFMAREYEKLEVKEKEIKNRKPKNTFKRALCGATAGLMLMGAVNAYARGARIPNRMRGGGESVGVIDARQRQKLTNERKEKLIMKTIERLGNMPIDPSPMGNEGMKRMARMEIKTLAVYLKVWRIGGRIETNINIDDIRDALELLHKDLPKFIDQDLGNKDNRLEQNELDKFMFLTKHSSGLREMVNMMRNYGVPK